MADNNMIKKKLYMYSSSVSTYNLRAMVLLMSTSGPVPCAL